MTATRDFALEATRRFLQSIVFVDDNIYYEIPTKTPQIDTPTSSGMQIFRPIAPISRTATTATTEAVKSEIENKVITNIDENIFHPKNLVESFAKERMVCALYEPAKGFATDKESELFKLCERADVIILDWEFYKEAGTYILPLIAGLVSESQTTVPHHVRLCAIYTTTPDLKKVASQIYDHLKNKHLSAEPDGELNLNAGSSRIVVLGKPTTGRPAEQVKTAEVAEMNLAARIIDEFASMHEGILPSMALHGLATVRTSSKKILTEPLPADAGRFVASEILKYRVVRDVAACGAEIPPSPEVSAPIAFFQFRELHLHPVGRTALHAAHEVADGNARRDFDEHVDMLLREHAGDDFHIQFLADLPDDRPDPLAQFTMQHLVAVFCDPDDVVTVVKNGMTSSAITHHLISEKGAYPPGPPFSEMR